MKELLRVTAEGYVPIHVRSQVATTLADEVDEEALRALEREAIRMSWPPYATATVLRKSVQVDGIFPLARTVNRARLSRAHQLVSFLNGNQLPVFSPLVMRSDAGTRVVLPPVVERSSDGLHYVMDGMHRISAARQLGYERIHVIVVASELLPPLPLDPCYWGDVATVDGNPGVAVTFPGYAPEYFRDTARFLDSRSVDHQDLGQALVALGTPEICSNSPPCVDDIEESDLQMARCCLWNRLS